MGWLDRILPALSPAPARSPQPRSPTRVKVAARTPPVVVHIPPPVIEPAPVPAVETPAAESERPQRPTRVSRRTASVDRAEAPPPAPSEEINALDRAIRLLRRHHDAGAALSALDAYLDRYPLGVLNREARFARVDALLILQRPDQALDALETLPLDDHRRSTELQVIRGELRARSNCTRAGQDFGAVLARNPDDGLAERALYGRGACRAKLGDVTGAVEDLRRYLERFPNGTHAMWARRWLESKGKAFTKGG
jgi:TolA-binding protein